MNRVNVIAKRDKAESSRNMFRLWASPVSMRSKTYGLSAVSKMKDLGVSSVEHHKILEPVIKLARTLGRQSDSKLNIEVNHVLDEVQSKHKVDLFFSYPVMNPQMTNQSKLRLATQLLAKVMKKFDTLQVDQSAKVIARNEKLSLKFLAEKEIVEREIINREHMQRIYKQLTIPAPFKTFMGEINRLSLQDKRELVRLISEKKRRSLKNEVVGAAYELMFAYDPLRDDFTAGIRSLYEHDHPHPTLLGGNDPEVLVAGTIDLVLDGDTLKIAKMRIDSGHFQPDADALEVIMRYVHQAVNPNYVDQLVLHTVEGDTTTPEIVINTSGLRK